MAQQTLDEVDPPRSHAFAGQVGTPPDFGYREVIVVPEIVRPGQDYRGHSYNEWELGRLRDLKQRRLANDHWNDVLARVSRGESPARVQEDNAARLGGTVYPGQGPEQNLGPDQYARLVLSQYEGSPNLGNIDVARPYDPRAWLAELKRERRAGTYVGVNSGRADPAELERNLAIARENVQRLERATPGSGDANALELLNWYRDSRPLSNPLIDPLFNPYTGGTSAFRAPAPLESRPTLAGATRKQAAGE